MGVLDRPPKPDMQRPRMTKDLTIRPAEHADGTAVFALLRQFAMSYRPERAAFERHYPRRLETDHTSLLVAAVGDQVVGYALAFETLTLYANGPITELQELVVDSEYRGRGVGRRLVESVIGRARARGSAEVTVATRRAGDYYDKLGFQETAGYYKLRLRPRRDGP